MAQKLGQPPRPLGLFSEPDTARVTGTERAALILCGVWLLGVVVFFVVLGGLRTLINEGGLVLLMALVAALLPIAVILMVAAAARSVRLMRDESQRLQATIEHMRQSFEDNTQSHKTALPPSVEKRMTELESLARSTEKAIATFTTRRDKTEAVKLDPLLGRDPEFDQPALALGIEQKTTASAAMEDVIKALNFPEDADDAAGFAALRRVLSDTRVAPTIKAAQDVLTLFSEDGVYMDDLRPDRARPTLWRRFIEGERGPMIAALGGVRDRSSLALTAGRMRQDAKFREQAHHFLRHFDRLLQRLEPDASDAELAALTNTRSARAFMLLGRVAGIFD